jgi:hypothetical protein
MNPAPPVTNARMNLPRPPYVSVFSNDDLFIHLQQLDTIIFIEVIR